MLGLSIFKAEFAPIAQLDRAPGFGPGGRGFESLSVYQVNAHPCGGFLLGNSRLFEPPTWRGENCQWQFARESSPESNAFKAEVTGSQNVTRIPLGVKT